MPVAKTYAKNRIIGEPYKVSGRMYVKIEYEPKPGVFSSKQVRWYNEKEYAAMYGEVVDPKSSPFYKSQKEVLGFKNGYIWLLDGNTYDCKEELKEFGAVYRKWWKWGLSSELELPETLPEGVWAVKLPWEKVGADEENLLPEDRVIAIVNSILYENKPEEEKSTSQHVGNIGERLEFTLTVDRAVETQYGRMHIMKDEDGNVFVWSTSAKIWEKGEVHHFKGTIKDHKEYNGVPQTWLTRCIEAK